MTQATAARERARITTFLSQNRDPQDDSPRYTGGPMWTLPKKQVQALYSVVGTYDRMLKLRPEMVPWPPETPGKPCVPPPDHVLYSWTREIDAGETDPDPKLVKIMDERIMRRFKGQMRDGMETASQALQHLGQKVINNELDPRHQSQILSLGQAVNYGMGAYAQLHKALTDTSQPTIQIGRLTLNAGAPPPKRVKTKVAKQLAAPIDAEFREVE